MSNIFFGIKLIEKPASENDSVSLRDTATNKKEEFSLHRAIDKIVSEINNILDHGYSQDDVAAILSSGDIEVGKKAKVTKNIQHIAARTTSLQALREDSCPPSMVAYNSSNRSQDHQTRWNSR